MTLRLTSWPTIVDILARQVSLFCTDAEANLFYKRHRLCPFFRPQLLSIIADTSLFPLPVLFLLLNLGHRQFKMKAFLCLAAMTASASAGTLSLDMTKQALPGNPVSRTHARHLEPRRIDKFVTAIADRNQLTYYVNVTIGQPPQEVTLQIDTGSSDLFVLTDSVETCSNPKPTCKTPFTLSKSTTVEQLSESDFGGSPDFGSLFVDRTKALGLYMRDEVSIGGAVIEKQIMAVATEGTVRAGIFGLGLNTLESSSQSNVTYPQFIDNLVSKNIIGRRVFSVFLNGTHADSGTILFGGVDTERYYDDIAKLPLVSIPRRNSEALNDWAVNMTSLTARGVPDFPPLDNQRIILDTGSASVQLPEAQINAISESMEAIATTNDLLWVDCARAEANASLTFQFGTKSIYVSLGSLLWDLDDTSFEDKQKVRAALGPKAASWKNVCTLVITKPTSTDSLIFGGPFLRSAYLVFDGDNLVVGIAQANQLSSKTNVIEIAKGDAIPTNRGSAVPTQVVQTGSDTGKGKGDKKDNAGVAVRVSSAMSTVVAIAVAVMIV
ncbi:hypothetical protein VHEMI08120 [[Torrubiella] hemipterigena]|uniref:Peptidase A1 domain-containing protein n=1 Tax=[Torrubiella] hemipterigena TaxID=1531966 RepID=A0A0A1TMU9_9HYPO|nr:hypothetical protein VHEMI08120 [[Torrubiella] hemipterigena]